MVVDFDGTRFRGGDVGEDLLAILGASHEEKTRSQFLDTGMPIGTVRELIETESRRND
jgi:hypothetical protein